MDPLLCYPDPMPEDLTRALQEAGYSLFCVNRPDFADVSERGLTKEGWPGAVISALSDLTGALAICRYLRRREVPLSPLLLIVGRHQVGELQLRNDLFDDFCAAPFAPGELVARLEHLFWRSGRGLQPEVIEHGPLVLNLETYQAAVAGRTLDLTYMEYELLRFLASHPGKVFTRETLLSRVWGYEYYGGARTVDVHVRRLRAKLGEEHAHLIATVRSVGYRFGQGGWSPAGALRRIEGEVAGAGPAPVAGIAQATEITVL